MGDRRKAHYYLIGHEHQEVDRMGLVIDDRLQETLSEVGHWRMDQGSCVQELVTLSEADHRKRESCGHWE